MKNLLIYIASPISQGVVRDIVARACSAGHQLMQAGIPVLIPHLSVFLGMKQNYDGAGGYVPEVLPLDTTLKQWYLMGIMMVLHCDAVLRLPGDSVGADMETGMADKNNIPVFHSVEKVILWARDKL